MNQNYIQIFKNNSGGITIAYSKPTSDDTPNEMEDIQILAIDLDDADAIGHALQSINYDDEE